ncbi:DNA-directed RNA polymerase subunit alpha C-terminal domain-containing protein [Clostridium sp. AM54-37XD]|uniref:DNA-directed RNA polymerase subunit alpha C-terminal domain-containing protein n=1 Tax=unclassified Clostridium TaxID=2614128 RepID=UPI0032B7D92A
MNLRLISYKTNKMTKGSFMYAEKIEYDDIEMSSRLRNILRRNGFESLEGLREYPKEHFIKFRNMGQATLQELYQMLQSDKELFMKKKVPVFYSPKDVNRCIVYLEDSQ